MAIVNEHKTVRLGLRLGYGIGNIAYSLPHQIIASSFILYATTILKLPAVLAGLIMAISAVWDGLSDPVMGFISDNTESRRFGRRHQYLLMGTLLLTVTTVILWSLDPTNVIATNFWFILGVILVAKTALTIFVVPFNALGGELTTDYYERSAIQSYRASFYIFGMLIALVGSNMIFFRSTSAYPQGQLNPEAYPAMGVTFAIIIFVVGIINYFTTKKVIPRLPKRTKIMCAQGMTLGAIWKDLLSALKNKDLRALVIMIFIIEVGFQMGIAISFHVNTYTYNLTGPMIGLLALIILFFSIASQPLWIKFTKLFGKKKSLMIAMVIGYFSFLFSPWTHVWWKWFSMENQVSLLCSIGLFNIFAGISNGAFMSIPFSMVADSVDVGEVNTGKRDEGLFYGLYTFAYKLGTSISLAFAGLIITYTRFDPDLKIQDDFTNFNLAMIPSYFILIIIPLAFLALRGYSITLESYQAIRLKLDNNSRESLISD